MTWPAGPGFKPCASPPGPSAGWGPARRRQLAARASGTCPPPGWWAPWFQAGAAAVHRPAV
eukprot:2104391-Prymnesium_polylepis.1